MNTELNATITINPAAALAPVDAIPPEPSSIYALLRRWQPMGKRIVLKQPYISDEKSPIFAIRVTPFIPHVNSGCFPFNDPVYILPNNPNGPLTAEPAVHCVTYDIPPPLSMLSTAYRYWTGQLKYNLRFISSALSQGYVIAGIARNRGVTDFSVDATEAGYHSKLDSFRQIEGLGASFQEHMLEAYTRSDLSLSRHIEVTIPYNRVYPIHDPRNDMYWAYVNHEVHPKVQQGADFLVVSIRGATFVGPQVEDLVIELEISAGDDFRLFKQLDIAYDHWNTELETPIVHPQFNPGVVTKLHDKYRSILDQEPTVEESKPKVHLNSRSYLKLRVRVEREWAENKKKKKKLV